MQVAAIDEKAGIWDGGGENRLFFIPTTWLPVSTQCWEDGNDQVPTRSRICFDVFQPCPALSFVDPDHLTPATPLCHTPAATKIGRKPVCSSFILL